MEAWGFRYKTAAFVWVKKNRKNGGNFVGMGAYTRANAEVCLLGITARDVFGGTDGALLAEGVRETVAILGLLHDVCKVNVYHEENKRRKHPDSGAWEDYKGYTYRGSLPLGHGEKSLFLIARFMPLTDEEALAIGIWEHMTAQ